MSIKSEAIIIRDETTQGANTASRVGGNLVDIADDLIAKQNEININTSKVGITTQQAADIIANNSKNLQDVLSAGDTYVVGNSTWTWNGDYFTILNSLAGGLYLSGDEGMVFTDNTGETDGYTVITGTGIQLGNGVNFSEISCFNITQDRAFNLPDADGTFALKDDITINSKIASEPTGSDVVLNVVSLTQAEYDTGTKIATTFYIITD